MFVETTADGSSHISSLSSIGKQGSNEKNGPGPDDQLGQYKILNKIGAGEMGVVYRAHDPQLDRFVALKILHGDVLKDPEVIQRFRQEAESLACLRHPFIINIYDFRQEGDLHYFAMDYVAGQTLEELIATGALTLQEKLEIFTRFLRALGHAHSKGVIHRDIKPSNIIVDEDNNPHITDFGLSRSLERPSQLTPEGSSPVTTAYMAPEQLRGNKQTVDQRCDLYSAGVVFYQLLCGQLPYQSQNAATLFKQIVSNQPASMRLLGSKIPQQVRESAARSLEKNVDERYQDANTWADDLQHLVDSPRKRHSTPTFDLPPRVLIGLACILATCGMMTHLVVHEALRNPVHASTGPHVATKKPIPKDPIEELFSQVRTDLNDNHYKAALDKLIKECDNAQEAMDEARIAQMAKQLRSFLKHPDPINRFAEIAPRQTNQLCKLAWSEDSKSLEKLADLIANTGITLIKQASTSKQGTALLQTARYLGHEKPILFLWLGVGYARERQYDLALEQLDRYIYTVSDRKAKGSGQLVRAKIRLAQGRAWQTTNKPEDARLALEKASMDLEAAMKGSGVNLMAGQLPARRLLLETYIRLNDHRKIFQLLGLYSRSLNQAFNPFTLWSTAEWARLASQRVGDNRPKAFSWRFDRFKMELSAPIELRDVYLIPESLRFAPLRGSSCLSFYGPGRSKVLFHFVPPATWKQPMLSLHGMVPPGTPSKPALITISINGQTILDRQQVLPFGTVGKRSWPIAKWLKPGEPNRVMVRLDKRALWQFRLRELRVFDK